jgi:putative hydrolase of the HAD superfamily
MASRIRRNGRSVDPPAPDGARVRDWIFDLDNTVYPASCGLFDQVDRRIVEFVQDFLGLDSGAARLVQRRYFREHGSCLRGLMVNHALDPARFLDYVHDIDMSPLSPAPELAAVLGRLPGRKIIFTNGSTRHAEKVLGHLGVAQHFTEIHDIAAADYLPKPVPQSYRILLDRHGVVPAAAVYIEDIARNLEPAAALGMTTAWIAPADRDTKARPPRYVHHVVENLARWLASLIGRPSSTGR